MNFKSTFWSLLNISARVFGLMFTAAGAYFAARGVHSLIDSEVAELKDVLGFPPSFRPFVIASVCLIIGVNFIRGEAHRPDLQKKEEPNRHTAGRTRSWWTGKPLNPSSRERNS